MTELTPEEQRVLGALIEKQYTTPDVYPLTMNGLLSACNQTSNRNPVVRYDESVVQRALDSLREQGLTRIVYSPSNRATKYRQVFEEEWALLAQEVAIMSVLLLRGPQTVGELRGRTDRLASFASLEEVEHILERLRTRDQSLVVRLERQPGQKEARWSHTLGEVRTGEEGEARAPAVAGAAGQAGGQGGDRVAELEAEVATLRAELDALRADFDGLRRELE